MSSVFSQSYPCLPALQCQNNPNDVLLLVWCDDKRTMMIIIIMPRLTRHDDSHQHGDDALQAPPRHPFHDELVKSRRSPSSRTRRNQYHAAGALACARRRNNVTRCNGVHLPPYGITLTEEDEATTTGKGVTCTKITSSEERTCVFGDIFADRQKRKQTKKQTRSSQYLMWFDDQTLLFYLVANIARMPS